MKKTRVQIAFKTAKAVKTKKLAKAATTNSNLGWKRSRARAANLLKMISLSVLTAITLMKICLLIAFHVLDIFSKSRSIRSKQLSKFCLLPWALSCLLCSNK